MHEYDCLLLEHVFGQRPDDAHKVKAFVLETIASDPSLQQTELLFLGLFGRACRIVDSGSAPVRPARRVCSCRGARAAVRLGGDEWWGAATAGGRPGGWLRPL